MSYEPFYERFPKVAEKETRTIIAVNDPDIPDGEYSLMEAYCNEPDCDCRRVFFNVYSWKRQQVVAVIAYGWESQEYYVQWLGDNDPRTIRELQGPVLNLASRQSEFAPALEQKIRYVLEDKSYLARIKRHYKMFRETVVNDEFQRPEEHSPTSRKVSRNAPCPCGSGKKYKKCCGRKIH